MAPTNKSSETTILLANGVNLDMLGERESHIYGKFSLKDLEKFLKDELPAAAALAKVNVPKLVFFQTNDEAEFLEKLSQDTWDGIVINAGAWTHTSLALGDRLAAIKAPFVEVHISNIAAREEFRHRSYFARYASGVVYGFGMDSYLIGLIGLLKSLRQKAP